MNNTNIGSEGSQKPISDWVDGTLATMPQGGIPASFYQSVLEKSDQQTQVKQNVAGVPRLPVPDLLLNSFEMNMYKISEEVLHSWSESLRKEAEVVKDLINSPTYLARQEEIRKINAGLDKIEAEGDYKGAVDHSQSTVINPDLQGAKIDIVDKYAWLQYLGLGLTAATSLAFLDVNPVNPLKANSEGSILGISMGGNQGIQGIQNTPVKGVDASIGAAGAVGSFGIQNAQGVQDSQGNIVGVREVPTKDSLTNPSTITGNPNVPNTGSYVDEIELTDSQSGGTAQFLGQLFLVGVSELALFQAGATVAGIGAVNAAHSEAMIIQNAWDSMTQKPVDQATLVAGWLSALWGVGLIYKTSAEKVMTYGGEKAKDGGALTMDFAKAYAQKVLEKVNSPEFLKTFQSALATATTGGESNTDSLLTKSKILLLSLALGLLSKLEVGSYKDEGWISEMDFAGLLNGQTDINQHDLFETSNIKGRLIAQINDLFEMLDPRESAQVKGGLLSFMATNPSLDALLDQQGAFERVLNQPSFEQGAFGKTPV